MKKKVLSLTLLLVIFAATNALAIPPKEAYYTSHYMDGVWNALRLLGLL